MGAGLGLRGGVDVILDAASAARARRVRVGRAIAAVRLGFGEGERAGGGRGGKVERVAVVTDRRRDRRVGAHSHGARGSRHLLFGVARVLVGLIHELRLIVLVEERALRVSQRANTAAGVRDGRRRGVGRRRAVPRVVRGQVRGKVADERVERLGAEELDGVLPLLGPDELGVGNDLERGRLEGIVQLAHALLLAVVEQAAQLVGGAGLVRELVDIVVEGGGVLDG